MRKISCLFLLLLLLIVLAPRQLVFASSIQAYQDYLYQNDLYRQTLSGFETARNEYRKYQSLASQADVLAKAKIFLEQRVNLLYTYLLFLNEKISENKGLSAAEKLKLEQYLRNEIVYLVNHRNAIQAINSLQEVSPVSQPFEKHYQTLSAVMHLVAFNIQIGQLNDVAQLFTDALQQIQSLVGENRSAFTPEKLEQFDRWLVSIAEKQKLYQQLVTQIQDKINLLNLAKPLDAEDQIKQNQKKLLQAQVPLKDANNYFKELINALKTVD